MDYMSHPQTGTVRAIETRIQLIERVLEERESQKHEDAVLSETECTENRSEVESGSVSQAEARTEFVRRILVQKGMTLSGLAAEAGLDPKTIRNYVDGKSKSYPHTRKRIADALGVDVQDLPD